MVRMGREVGMNAAFGKQALPMEGRANVKIMTVSLFPLALPRGNDRYFGKLN
jgi:hypothetical protein